MTDGKKPEVVAALDKMEDLRGTFTPHNRETSIALFAGLVLGILFEKLIGMPTDAQIEVGQQLAVYLGAPIGAASGLGGVLKKYARK